MSDALVWLKVEGSTMRAWWNFEHWQTSEKTSDTLGMKFGTMSAHPSKFLCVGLNSSSWEKLISV